MKRRISWSREHRWVLGTALGAWLLGGFWSPAMASKLPVCTLPEIKQGGPKSEASQARSNDGLRVVSLNMHSIPVWEKVQPGLEAQPEVRDSEILLMQEFAQDDSDLLTRLSQALNLNYIFADNQDCDTTNCRQGLAIFSRLPLLEPEVRILPQNNLKYRNRCRIALSARVETAQGSLRLFNLHLDTRINGRRRVRQLKPILEFARSSDEKLLVGGDFNSANVLWIQSVVPIPFLQFQAKRVRKAMESEGFSTPFRDTGNTFSFPPSKLDWIFLRGVDAKEGRLYKIEFTDHKALRVVL